MTIRTQETCVSLVFFLFRFLFSESLHLYTSSSNPFLSFCFTARPSRNSSALQMCKAKYDTNSYALTPLGIFFIFLFLPTIMPSVFKRITSGKPPKFHLVRYIVFPPSVVDFVFRSLIVLDHPSFDLSTFSFLRM